jgi:malate dehydrogenase (oxaloacetate-decarboxylating)(NADP+)
LSGALSPRRRRSPLSLSAPFLGARLAATNPSLPRREARAPSKAPETPRPSPPRPPKKPTKKNKNKTHHHKKKTTPTTHPPTVSAGVSEADVTYINLLAKFREVPNPIDRYLLLRDLCRLSPKVYYSLLLQHTEEILPYIYTPTVGEACQRYHALPLKTRGLYLRIDEHAGKVAQVLKSWPVQRVEVVVMTDGERILGLGDLGANGMGISEGKITLYTAAAGVDPARCLPVCVDVGTNNQSLLDDPAYQGIRARRVTGEAYTSFLDEVVRELKAWQPHVLLQFEDFANHHAFELLEKHRAHACAFNDDIQGTACITLAGLLSAARATGKPLAEHTFLFLGAGEAGTGIGELIATYMHLRTGCTMAEGRKRCFFLDSKGLVCAERGLDTLQHHKRLFAHEGVAYCKDLLSAVEQLKPTALIGVSTIAKAFDEPVIKAMSSLNARPIIFPLSNPTSKAECTFEEAYKWSAGKVLFASGSPFPPLADAADDNKTHYPAQANNAYVFPAVGYAAVLTQARAITDESFVDTAEALSTMTTLEELDQGRLFPAFSGIRAVSKSLAARVAKKMVEEGLGELPEGVAQGADEQAWEAYVASRMWDASVLQKDATNALASK